MSAKEYIEEETITGWVRTRKGEEKNKQTKAKYNGKSQHAVNLSSSVTQEGNVVISWDTLLLPSFSVRKTKNRMSGVNAGCTHLLPGPSGLQTAGRPVWDFCCLFSYSWPFQSLPVLAPIHSAELVYFMWGCPTDLKTILTTIKLFLYWKVLISNK